ncbi:MAG TPA: hypothetical protein VN033_03135 [Vulgatibacter sp.]|nr:hypothetical protein [Vulgatibacter sp.]
MARKQDGIRIEVPEKNALRLYRDCDFVRQQVADVRTVRELHQLTSVAPTAYFAEALISAFAQAYGPLAEEELDAIDAISEGIHPEHPLYGLRTSLLTNAEELGSTDPAAALLLWGASVPSGRTLYREIGTLLAARWLRVHCEDPGNVAGLGLGGMIEEWARASGVVHPKTLLAIRRLVQNDLVARLPRTLAVPLGHAAVELARRLGGGHPELTLALFRCFQRIAAVQHDGEVRWRSTWLRGAKTNKDAIPGASTYATKLTEILRTNVLERTKGHLAGRFAATYRLRIPLGIGSCTETSVARLLRLELNANGKPVRKRP